MRACALLGGPKTQWPTDLQAFLAARQAAGDLLIGVDRGSLLLEELNLVPDLAVGDFDSLKKTELAQIEENVPDLRYSIPEKDFTDAELATKYAFVDYQVDALTLYGATGGRLDHFLTNLLMVVKSDFSQYAENIELVDQQNELRFYWPGQHLVNRLPGYTYFGVAPLTAVTGLSITGAKYELNNYTSAVPLSFASNEFLPGQDAFDLSFAKGIVAVIQTKDIDRYQSI
ncbi:thiamine diphosphokinase [Lactobacillus xylocopicola]|uniref:Thiamine diphosphokinase n=1 Tax=Lactobacillus xylocopicola TaxID=2976676 RepID=A0ABM8BHC1_9LACO|nr:thiamine diphosphokinase [Lactobacillus xylocopicola]BDR60683.1 thiamine pyrophosphokinase [Lactobacillus xylocopicola]